MTHKYYQYRYWQKLWLLLFLCLPLLASAQPAGVIVTPVPEWVRELPWLAPTNVTQDEKSQGTRSLLFDTQDRPKTTDSYTRTVVLMLNDSGVQDSGSLSFSFNPEFQQLELHRVAIYRNGKTINRLDLAKVRVIEQEPGLADEDMLTGDKKAVLFVEDLRIGDVLECAYTVHGSNPVIGDHYYTEFDTQSEIADDRKSFRLLWEKPQPPRLHTYQTDVQPVVQPFGAGTEYLWNLTNTPAAPDEDLQPSGYEPYPYVEVSDYPDWASVVNWSLPLYKITPTNLPAELTDLVTSWSADGKSPEDKVLSALQFVQDDVRYTGIELGPDSYHPADPVETFQKRFGDCKGKVNLMCLLLQLMKIDACPALVSSDGNENLDRHLPSPFLFDHVILRVDFDGHYLWLDPTCSHQGGSLDGRYVPHYGKALVIRAGNNALENIPPKPGALGTQNVISTFNLTTNNGPVHLNVLTEYNGSDADDMRESIATTSQADLSKNYINYYTRLYPGIQKDQSIKIQDDRHANILTVEESYLITNLWTLNDSGHEYVADFHADNLYGMLSDPTTRVRKTPLAITYPLIRHQRLVVHLTDPDWNIPELTTNVDNDVFSFHYHRLLTGSTATYDYDFKTKLHALPPESVPQYLKEYDHLQNLLVDTLQHSDDTSSSSGGVNWLMTGIGVLAFAAGSVGCICYWRRTSAQVKYRTVPPPILSPEELKYRGLGGWLILVAVGLFAQPLFRIYALINSWSGYFSMSVWRNTALPTGANYHPFYGPLAAIEMSGHILLFILNVLVLCLFFAKRQAFPRVFIFMAASLAVFFVLDDICTSLMFKEMAMSHADSFRGVFYAALWCTYMVKSKRVKATFTR